MDIEHIMRGLAQDETSGKCHQLVISPYLDTLSPFDTFPPRNDEQMDILDCGQPVKQAVETVDVLKVGSVNDLTVETIHHYQ